MQERAIVQVNHLQSVWTNTLITEAPLQSQLQICQVNNSTQKKSE